MSIISDINIQILLDSSGKPGLCVRFTTESGQSEVCISVCHYEPSSPTSKSLSAPSFVHGLQSHIQHAKSSVIPHLIGISTTDQIEFDAYLHEIDGTELFSQIGPDIARALSYANAHSAAKEYNIPLYRHLGGIYAGDIPLPFVQIPTNACAKDTAGNALNTAFQPMFQPVLTPMHASSMQDLIPAIAAVYESASTNPSAIRGMDGIKSIEAGFEEIQRICAEILESCQVTMQPGLICRHTSSKSEKEEYHLGNIPYTREDYIQNLIELVQAYDLFYLESPLWSRDIEGYVRLTSEIGATTLVANATWQTASGTRPHIQDVLTSTNSMVIDPCTLGTISDIYDMTKRAKNHGLETVIGSALSADPTCAHIGCAFGCIGIQLGQNGQEIETFNELIRIEESL
jgi:enolase